SRAYEVLGNLEEQDRNLDAGLELNPDLWTLQTRRLLRMLEDNHLSEAHEFTKKMTLLGRTTSNELQKMIHWFSDPDQAPDEEILSALYFTPKAALLAGQIDLWFEISFPDSSQYWETTLVHFANLSSMADEQQFQQLNAHPRAKQLIVETRLDEYWRQTQWPPRCRPLGEDDFVCE
ncbi:MAG: hypothetical protein ACR2QG_06725, partial [Gammaproteobacteria bacterium]